MKHNIKITLILVFLFLISQFVGLYVTDHYLEEELPYGFERPQIEKEFSFLYLFVFILIATVIIYVLAKFKLFKLWKFWFFLGVLFTLSISFSSFFTSFIAFIAAFVLTFFKIFKRNIIIHNLTEIFIYGALAAVFVPIMNLFSATILLIGISIYDFIAVNKTKHMIKLAKFQKKSKLFAGLYIPYKKDVAILGGGDIGFPLLFNGVLLFDYGLIALIVPFFTSLSLFFLLLMSKKKKYYPAMPFLTMGCFVGYLVLLALV